MYLKTILNRTSFIVLYILLFFFLFCYNKKDCNYVDLCTFRIANEEFGVIAWLWNNSNLLVHKNYREEKYLRKNLLLIVVLLMSVCFCGCQKGKDETIPQIVMNTEEAETVVEDETATEEPDDTMLNVATEDALNYSEIPVSEKQEEEEPEVIEEDSVLKTEDGKVIVDLIMFMGQSNMSGTGGDVSHAPKVTKNHGYEFRAVSDPTRLYPIEEPFGINENDVIADTAYGKKGSMVSAFANKYYEITGVPIVAVSASSGGKDTDFWMDAKTIADFSERQKRAQVWLESNDYYIRNQYVIWLQGESDALDGVTSQEYNQNMDNIIRPLFIGGLQKVFIITPGRTLTSTSFFDNIITAQLRMCKSSGYYALATTVLNAVSTEYMIDEYHYNQSVLNVLGKEAAESAAYYTMNRKEKCVYDYKHNETFVPEGFEYEASEMVVEPIDYNTNGDFERYE